MPVAASPRPASSSPRGVAATAARYGACAPNPVRDVSSVRITKKASRALTVDDVAAILRGMTMSTRELPPLAHAKRQTARTTIANYRDEADLVDVVTMFAATGCRISEVLGLRWSDVNLDTKTASITGKVIGVKGRGLVRDNCTKTEAGRRVLPLPSFAVSMLLARQVSAQTNMHNVVFPSAVGTLRDPDGVSKQWRRVRDALGYEWVTSHLSPDLGHHHRRRGHDGAYRRRPARAPTRVHDAGRVHGSRGGAHRGSRGA